MTEPAITPQLRPDDTLSLRKWHVVAPLLVLQLWPLGMAMEAQRLVPEYIRVYRDILKGIPVPELTLFIINTRQMWFAVPVLTAAMVLVTLHPRIKTLAWPAWCLVATLLTGYGMKWLLFEGMMQPIVQFMRNLFSHG